MDDPRLYLAALGILIWVVTHTRVLDKNERVTPSALVQPQFKSPRPLAKGNPGLVQCGVAKSHVPIYRRTPELTRRAQDLAVSVKLGKKAIASHMEAHRQGVCNGKCMVRPIIAGVVRDRKTLKKLEYDQPF